MASVGPNRTFPPIQPQARAARACKAKHHIAVDEEVVTGANVHRVNRESGTAQKDAVLHPTLVLHIENY